MNWFPIEHTENRAAFSQPLFLRDRKKDTHTYNWLTRTFFYLGRFLRVDPPATKCRLIYSDLISAPPPLEIHRLSGLFTVWKKLKRSGPRLDNSLFIRIHELRTREPRRFHPFSSNCRDSTTRGVFRSSKQPAAIYLRGSNDRVAPFPVLVPTRFPPPGKRTTLHRDDSSLFNVVAV